MANRSWCWLLIITALTLWMAATSVFGCYSHLPLASSPRRQTAILELNGKIYFAGGRPPGVGALYSDLVEVLDTRTNTWAKSFRLSEPRVVNEGIAALDPYILFMGGQMAIGFSQAIDIWNSETETLQTIYLPVDMRRTSSFLTIRMIDRSAYILPGNTQLYELNLDTLTWTLHNTPQLEEIATITSNETHLFAFMRQPPNAIHMFEVSTNRWTELATIPTNADRFVYTNNMLFAITSRLIYYIHLDTLAQGIYAYPTAEVVVSSTAVEGNDVFIANQGLLTIHNPIQRTSFQYEFDGLSEQIGGVTALVNRTLYIPLGHSSNGGAQTLDLRTLFQPLPNLPRDRSPIFIERGIMFWAEFGEPRIYTYNIDTAEYTWHEHRAFNNSLLDRRFVIGNKMVLRGRYQSANVPELLIYNFDDHTFSVIDTPEEFSYGIATVIDDVMVISGGFQSVWLFNVTSSSFQNLQLTIIPTFFASSRGFFITQSAVGNLYAIDVHTMQYHAVDVRLRSGTILPFDNVIVGVIEDRQSATIIGYDAVTKEMQRTASALDYLEMRSQAHRHFAVYYGPRADRTRVRVEMYDTMEKRWHTFNLPSSGPNTALRSFTSIGPIFYFSVGSFIDVYDTRTGTLSVFPFQFNGFRSVNAVGSKLIVETFGASGTATETRFFIFETTTRRYSAVSFHGMMNQILYTFWKNKVICMFQEIRSMDLPTIFDGFDDEELFIGQSTNLTVTAVGRGLSYTWTRDTEQLKVTTPTLLLDNATVSQRGTYKVTVKDHCDRPMEHSAELQVHDVPYFDDGLQDSIVLCHENALLSTHANGVQVSYRWSINNVDQPNIVNSTLTLSQEQLPCNSQHNVCVTASNPSGETSMCAVVRLVELGAVISGPEPTVHRSKWFAKDIVDLEVSILDKDCSRHSWYQDGVLLETFNSFSSQHRVQLTSSMEKSQFEVQVRCGNNPIWSRAFSFGDISALPVYGLALIIVGIVTAALLFVVIVIVLRKRLAQSQTKEVELLSLLSKAKTESLQKDRTPILNATIWEWTPTDEFTYQSLNDLPVSVNTTDLKFSEKGAPLDVDVYYNRVIKFENKSKSVSKKGLKEKLINGTSIDIYAPKSPKYQIIVDPASFVIDNNDTIEVTVSIKMQLTAKCNITLVLVLDQHKIYSAIEFKVTSTMSTWIDLEEIQMSGEFLGGGGFGSVVRGVYRGQDVAVKKLLSQYLTDDMKIEFEREVTLMKSLRHPNIVQFVGASNVKESLAIVIEYAPLGSLASVMEKQSLSVQFKVMCLLETAKALQFLHSNGVIHRDIKPQNILVFSLETRASVHVKLTDFGTSRFIADDPTTITKNVGTIAFMAPEALGRNPRIDKSADVYSFGVLMWSVLFEQVPFKEFKWDSDIEQHVKSGNRLPFPHGHEMDPSLVKLIEECWQHEPSIRPTMPIVVQRLSNIKL